MNKIWIIKEERITNINTLELLQLDIEDLKGFINCEKDELTEDFLKNQVRAILVNLEEHLEELIKNKNT